MERYSNVSYACSSNNYQPPERRSLVAGRALGATLIAAIAVIIGQAGFGSLAIAQARQETGTHIDNTPPAQIISANHYDGKTDDLLTAGLGISGLAGGLVNLDDTLKPSYSSLRRRAIQQNYRGLIDVRTQSGFGTTYGPIDDIRIAGKEILAALPDPSGRGQFSALLQIPVKFNTQNACLVVVASSGSRGIFGALPTAGEWALQQGCAVVHTDKGTGTGIYALGGALGLGFDGQVLRDTADSALAFRPQYHAEDLAQSPLIAFKHAHSGANPEQHWGEHVLRAGKWGLSTLNRELPQPVLSTDNTLIVAVGISNGGGAVLRAIEQDSDNFFDGAIAAEPNIANNPQETITLQVSNDPVRVFRPLSLYEWSTWHALFQPCAVLAEELPTVPLGPLLSFRTAQLSQWCRSLHSEGLLQLSNQRESATSNLTDPKINTLAQAARARLLDLGVEPQALRLGALNVQFDLWQAVIATYASALSASEPAEHPCAIGFAATTGTGEARMIDSTTLALAFADSSGIAPTAGIELVARDAAGQYNTRQARSFETTQCLHGLTGTLQPAIEKMSMRGYRDSRPVLLLHGREDALVSVTHTSRAYAARSGDSGLRYYELRSVQHFDAFLPVPGMNFRPMQPALNTALRRLFAHLRNGSALPPSQVTDGDLSDSPGQATIFHANGTITIPK
jgi:hydroxybutyrate-dimer hydrolase